MAQRIRLRMFLMPLAGIALVVGCEVTRPQLPTEDELTAFEAAAPVRLEPDYDRLYRSYIKPGPYRVGAGDLLQVELPATVRQIRPGTDAEQAGRIQISARVAEAGTITLPLIGQWKVAGHQLHQIESMLAGAYHPEFLRARPNVLVRVNEPHRTAVVIFGDVGSPGLHELPRHRMSLIAALTAADGVVGEGTHAVRVIRAADRDESIDAATPRQRNAATEPAKIGSDSAPALGRGPQAPSLLQTRFGPSAGSDVLQVSMARSEAHAAQGEEVEGDEATDGLDAESADIARPATRAEAQDSRKRLAQAEIEQAGDEVQVISLPIQGYNTPFKDVQLQPGDILEVRRLPQRPLVVLGLVDSPGAYDYPPDAEFTLQEAIAQAGGVDELAEPSWATVYRESADGEIIAASFPLRAEEHPTALTQAVRPGDVVSVEHTLGTRFRQIANEVLRARIGFSYDIGN